MTKPQLKWTGVASLVALSLFLLYPTADGYTMDVAQRERLETSRLRPKRLLNLGEKIRLADDGETLEDIFPGITEGLAP